MIAAELNMPVFAASAPMSSITASSCAATISVGISWTAVTPTVFWAVIAVMTVEPYTPSALKVLRSAWIPAPAPESDPAIVRALGIRVDIATSRIAATFTGPGGGENDPPTPRGGGWGKS